MWQGQLWWVRAVQTEVEAELCRKHLGDSEGADRQKRVWVVMKPVREKGMVTDGGSLWTEGWDSWQ